MSSKYQYWLTFNNEKERLRLPVLPESFKVVNGSKNESVDIAGLGEITIKQNRPAFVFSFSSFFPSAEFPGIEYDNFPTPDTCRSTIERWKEADKPVHFIITGASVNVFVTIETFEYEERGGDIGTLHYSITLKEYRPVQVRQVSVNVSTGAASVNQEKQRTDNRVQPSVYVVKEGDYLYKIAKSVLGNSERWNDIAKTNSISAPYTIYVNQKLKIPG